MSNNKPSLHDLMAIFVARKESGAIMWFTVAELSDRLNLTPSHGKSANDIEKEKDDIVFDENAVYQFAENFNHEGITIVGDMIQQALKKDWIDIDEDYINDPALHLHACYTIRITNTYRILIKR